MQMCSKLRLSFDINMLFNAFQTNLRPLDVQNVEIDLQQQQRHCMNNH